jgi:hypothetical protein
MVQVASGEGLQRGPVDVPGTLLHDVAAHGLAVPKGQWHQPLRPLPQPPLCQPPASSAWTSPHLRPIGWSATSVPDPTAARYAKVLAELARGASPVAPGRAGRPGRTGPLPQRPGLFLRLWSAYPGGPLGPRAGPIGCAGYAQPFEPEDDEGG